MKDTREIFFTFGEPMINKLPSTHTKYKLPREHFSHLWALVRENGELDGKWFGEWLGVWFGIRNALGRNVRVCVGVVASFPARRYRVFHPAQLDLPYGDIHMPRHS